MGVKKRAVAAAAISGTSGVVAGFTASHLGLDPVESAKIGGFVSSSVGELLFQVLRLTSDDAPDSGSSPDAMDASRGVCEENSEATGDTGIASDNTNNALGTATDTAGMTEATPSVPEEPRASHSDGAAPDAKHPKHRKLHRAARRRAERRLRHEKEEGHGAS